MPAINVQFEDLLDLAEELRGAGFDLGTQQYVAAQDLLIALAAHGQLPADPRAWRTLLAPIFCASPGQQEEFYQRFGAWVERHPGLAIQAKTDRQSATSPIEKQGNSKATWRQVFQSPQARLIAPMLLFILLFITYLRTVGTMTSRVISSEASQPIASSQSDTGLMLWLVITLIPLMLFLIPLMPFALWYLRRWYRRRLFLQKLQIRGTPRLQRITVQGAAKQLFQSSQFRRVIQELRRHRWMQARELDIPTTVRATIRQGGLFTPAYGMRRTMPEYLLLIDRASMHDEQARFGEELAQRLEAGGVFVDRYYFQGDARTCRRLKPLSPSFTMADLAARHPDHRLLIFGDGAGFFDPFTGAPHRWLELFDHWEFRALLTPETPAQWGYREWALAEHKFLILPADETGLAALSESLHTGVAPVVNGMNSAPPFPELIAERPKRWLERHAPQPAVIERLCKQLCAYLGDDGWYWLSACAVYPQVTWDITLYLGFRLFGSQEEMAERLLALVRLPWFRYGTMPDWLRERLIGSLTKEQEHAVRGAIEELLHNALRQPGEAMTLEVAVPQQPRPPEWWQKFTTRVQQWGRRRELYQLLQMQPEDSPLRDYVSLNFLTGWRTRRLAMRAPDLWRRLLFNEGRAALEERHVAPIIASKEQPAAQPHETVPHPVRPEVREQGQGAFNPVVLALMAEAYLSRVSSGLIKTAVPLYALLVFGLDITSVMALALIQNTVPLLLRPIFGTLADKYGKKNVFMVSLIIRTLVSLLYAVATLPLLFLISFIRGVADSAKGPSASAMIADNTDEKHIAQAYSWYTTTKSASGGIGEAVAAFALVLFLMWFAGMQTVKVNVAVLDKITRTGANAEEIIKDPTRVQVGGALPGTETDPTPSIVIRVEERDMSLSAVPIDDLPKVVEATPLRKSLVLIFLFSTLLSLGSLVLVHFFIKENKKEEMDEKEESGAITGHLDAPREQPNVWAFSLLGMALTAPAYMVTGEFFIILAVKLEVTSFTLGWIKILAETIMPLLFGPFFGWLADRIGAGKVIALRSLATLLTSFLFWIVPWFAGTALLGLVIGFARAVDEIGKAAFNPSWGAITAKVSSFNLAARGKTMGILEGGIDASDLAFPVIAAAILQYLSLGPLMFVRVLLTLGAEVYRYVLMRTTRL
jgi:MFS family permease